MITEDRSVPAMLCEAGRSEYNRVTALLVSRRQTWRRTTILNKIAPEIQGSLDRVGAKDARPVSTPVGGGYEE
jgi:hypothetical protein